MKGTKFLPLTAILLAACGAPISQTPASTQLNALAGQAVTLGQGNWNFVGDASQYQYVRVSGNNVTATVPGDYALSSGNQRVTLHVTGPETGQLNLTEVGLSARQDASGWVELYNGTGQTINLGDYSIQAPSRDLDSGAKGYATFGLPAQELEAGAYLLVSGKLQDNATDGPQAVFVRSGRSVPFWTDEGAVKLVRGGKVTDQLSFSESGAVSAQSSGGPSIRVASVSPDQHLTSVSRTPESLRAGLRGASADAWQQIAFPSPGAMNNALPAATGAQSLREQVAGDYDYDGIPDSYETSTSGPYNGIYVYNLGARPNQTDIFLELDWMNSSSSFIRPQKAGIDKMVAAFRNAGFSLHVDAGNAFTSSFSIASYNLGGGNVVPYQKCTLLGFNSFSCGGILSTKYGTSTVTGTSVKNFNLNRLNLFRYGLLANSQQSDGSNGSSGLAEISGNDFIVTMGGWGASSSTQYANQQGATIMHEFGHTLGLRHGGFEDTNWKPNYYSIMNYAFQLTGLDDTPSKVWERVKLRLWSCADLTYNDPCMTSFKMDYSYGNGGTIDEGAVNENAGINRGTAWIDWNNNGAVNTSVRTDVNNDGYIDSGQYGLDDSNDWDMVSATFAYVSPTNQSSDVNGGRSLSVHRNTTRLDVAANDVQPVVAEEVLHHD